MKLFIIGNGFDLAHDIKSKYWHFGEYLQEHYPYFYDCLMAAINYDDGIWSDFEGELPSCGSSMEDQGLQLAQERLDELDYDPMNDEGIGFWVSQQLVFINELPEVLRAWIESVDIHKPKAYVEDLFSAEDLFVTFNYTNTLEKIYGIPSENILHIHGNVANPDDVLIMGHGDNLQIQYAEKNYNKAVSEFADCAASVYECVLNFLEKTYKYTGQIISENIDFLDELHKVDEIVIIGCSLSKIDYPYFKYIKELGDFEWTVIYYNSSKWEDTLKNKENAEQFLKSLHISDKMSHIIPDSQVLLSKNKQ